MTTSIDGGFAAYWAPPLVPLDAATTATIQRALRIVLRRHGGVPLSELTALGGRPGAYRVTVDSAISRELGAPVVVVQPRAALNGRASFPVLSSREREVAALVALGYANRRIAQELGISTATVKDHVHHVLSKLGMSSRIQLVAAMARDYEAGVGAGNPSNDGSATKPAP